MVQIAERASLLDQEADKNLLIERANQLWDRQAMFEWDMVDESSCNWSTTSDSDSSDAEGNGLRFNSLSWEDEVAKVSTEPDLLNTLQQSPYAQQFYAYQPAQQFYACQPDQILNPSSTRHGYDGSLNAGPQALSYPYNQYPLVGATDKLQYAQTSLNGPTPSIYSVSEAEKQFDVSQRTPKGSLQSPVDDISYQNMQHSRCLSCGATTMWPGASFCLTCMLNYDLREDLSEAPPITSSAGDNIGHTSRVMVPRKPFETRYCCNFSDVLLVKADKTTGVRKRNSATGRCMVYDSEPVAPTHMQFDASSSAPLQGTEVTFSNSFSFFSLTKLTSVCQLSADAGTCHGQEPHDRGWIIEPCECFKPRSSHPYDRDKKDMTDSRVRKRKNLLV